MFLSSLRHCLTSLFRFSGRDSRAQFWPYAFSLFLLSLVAMQLAMMRVINSFFAFAMAHKEQSDVMVGAGGGRITIHGNPPEIVPVMQQMAIAIGAIAAVFIVLVAAAAVRRLHDRDRTGLWAALPAVFLATGIVGMWRVFGETGPGVPNPGLILLMFVNNLVYLAALVTLVVLLAGPGTPGPNEYGPGQAPD